MGLVSPADPPPYPVDDAAVHHVFDGGWIWVLRFNNGVTSAGVAAAPGLAKELHLEDGAPAWDRLLDRFPTIREQFADSEATMPFVHRAALPFRRREAAGPSWVLLPSAAAFVDPLLSTGFPLTLLGLERLARAIERSWGTPEFPSELSRIGRRTLDEADTAARLVAALYARMGEFPAFASLTLLYFAAASYAEAARRLGRPELSGAFLSADHPVFGPALARCCELAGTSAGAAELDRAVKESIAPFDVIGLSDAGRRNWYPVRADDLRASRKKLGATPEEVEAILRAMSPPTSSGPSPSSSRRLGPSEGAGSRGPTPETSHRRARDRAETRRA